MMTSLNIVGVVQMNKKHITIMINSTFPDMFGEHYYFIKEIFPKLKVFCRSHGIDIDYVDLSFSMTEKEFNSCRSIFRYFNSIDLDRTFFVCFRGQKLGCIPTPEDIDKITLQSYPELVDYIGDISFTELNILHALHPFEKCENGEMKALPPVKHSLFYFRNSGYLDDLNPNQRELYTCKPDCEDEFVKELKLAMAKDLVFNDKREFDKLKDVVARINITKYDGIWDDELELYDVVKKYSNEYADLNGESLDELLKFFKIYANENTKGCFSDFRVEGEPLKDMILNDFIRELKLEFPENFE